MPRSNAQPKPVHDESSPALPSSPEVTQEVTGERPVSDRAKNLLRFIEAANTRPEVAEKTGILLDARQRLAEAHKAWDEGGELSETAKAAAAAAAAPLALAVYAGTLNPKEITGLMGDEFGYKLKKKNGVVTNEPTKTPDGYGEVLRKRIIRAVNALVFADLGNASPDNVVRSMKGLEVGDVQPLANQFADGEMSIWTFYDAISDMKREHSTRVEAAFNVKTISTIRETLASDPAATAALFEQDRLLHSAYAALMTTIADIVGLMNEGGEA